MHDVRNARTCVTRHLILNYTNGKIPDFQHGVLFRTEEYFTEVN